MKLSKLILVHSPKAASAGLADVADVFWAAYEGASNAVENATKRLLGTNAEAGPVKKRALRVGFWDLDARVPRLPVVLEHLKFRKSPFALCEVQASLPAGMFRGAEAMQHWLAGVNSQHSLSEQNVLTSNLVAEDFYARAKSVRRDLRLDFLIGLTRHMIAGSDADGQTFWNYIAHSQKRLIIASTHDLRAQAREAGRPFEAAAVGIGFVQLLVQLSPRLSRHETRGCVLDLHADRNMVVSLRNCQIESECLKLIPVRYRTGAKQIMARLQDYPEKRQTARRARQKKRPRSAARSTLTKSLGRNVE